MDNPEKLATIRRQTKLKHNTICVGHEEFVQHRNKKHVFDIHNCVRLCEMLLKMLMC
jgi:hypothetical protein